MRIAVTDILRRCSKYLLGCLLALYLSAPAYAFTPSQLPLLSASVAPNLMLLIDNSGSMSHLLRDSPYNDNTDYGSVYNASSFCIFFCTYFQGDQVVGENVYFSSFSQGVCGSGYYMFYTNAFTSYCLKLPSPSGSSTLISANYLAYIISITGTNRTRDFSGGPIPTQSRMSAAISVATSLVTNNRNIRTGLAVLNPSGNNSVISYPVSDISTTDTTGNFNNLKANIAALTANGGTPLAETYYDITRYFRGLTSFYTPRTTYTSPIQYRCQKNYGVVITDGLPSTDATFPSKGQDPADPSGLLPNWDGNSTNDGPRTGSNADGDTLYLDDLAKFAYDIDMQTSTSTPSVDLAGKSWDTPAFPKQNMSTYTVGYTVSNQMLIDAATYGHGAYYQANGSDALTAALNSAVSSINSTAGSGGAGSANGSTLQNGSRFYQTLYSPVDWHGTVQAYSVDSTTGVLSTSPIWTTDTTITNTSSPAPTYQSWSTASNGSVITLSYGNFSGPQQTALNASVPATLTGISGADLIEWSKGVNKTGLRPRTLLLGDIVNSTLTAALPTSQTASDLQGDNTYTTFLSTKASKMNSSLLANGNDGFVHVINASEGAPANITPGAQVYAYMPSLVLPSIATLAATDYGSSKHKFTVDGQIAVFDTQLVAGGTWQTIAVGGLGAGGKSFYALQLFEGGGSNTVKALWEIRAPDTADTNNPFNDLGYAYSKPEVARISGGAGIVVVGNGYGSFTGIAALYVLNAATGALIRKIPVPVAAGETDNGLSSVKLRVNSQNIVQAAYAGDLKGHLWKFDLSGTDPATWTVAFGSKPLFTTPRGAQQPITVQPLLLDHPVNGKLVYVGTGKFSEVADKTTTALQDFYAIWDSTTTTGGIAESDLQGQTVTGSVVSGSSTYFTTSSNVVDWNTKKGWYLPLASASPFLGERIIYPAQTSRGRIIFTTAAVNSSDPCESTGTGRLFELDAATGIPLNYQVLDTNGDGKIDSSDTKVSALAIYTGIPNLAAIVSGTNGNNDNKYLLDSSGNSPIKLLEKGGSANVYQRIMWRQIQ